MQILNLAIVGDFNNNIRKTKEEEINGRTG